MRPIYCAESQDRIPIEYFSQGKAIWSGGRPYLKEQAARLGLRPDPKPPAEYADALRKAAPAPKPQIIVDLKPNEGVRLPENRAVRLPSSPLPRNSGGAPAPVPLAQVNPAPGPVPAPPKPLVPPVAPVVPVVPVPPKEIQVKVSPAAGTTPAIRPAIGPTVVPPAASGAVAKAAQGTPPIQLVGANLSNGFPPKPPAPPSPLKPTVLETKPTVLETKPTVLETSAKKIEPSKAEEPKPVVPTVVVEAKKEPAPIPMPRNEIAPPIVSEPVAKKIEAPKAEEPKPPVPPVDVEAKKEPAPVAIPRNDVAPPIVPEPVAKKIEPPKVEEPKPLVPTVVVEAKKEPAPVAIPRNDVAPPIIPEPIAKKIEPPKVEEPKPLVPTVVEAKKEPVPVAIASNEIAPPIVSEPVAKKIEPPKVEEPRPPVPPVVIEAKKEPAPVAIPRNDVAPPIIPEPVAKKIELPKVEEPKPPVPPVVVEAKKEPAPVAIASNKIAPPIVPEPVAKKVELPKVEEPKPSVPPVVVEAKKEPAPVAIPRNDVAPPIIPEPIAKKIEPPKVEEPKPPVLPVVVEAKKEPAPVAPKKVIASPDLPETVAKPPEPPKPPEAKPPDPKPPAVPPPKAAPKTPAAAGAANKPAPKAAPAPKPAGAPADEEEMKLRIALQPGVPLSVEEMKGLEILEGIPEGSIKMLLGGIVRREFKKGDLICRQGEYASTAFYVLSGTAEIYIETPDKAAFAPLRKKKRTESRSLYDRFIFWVQGRKEGARKSKSGIRPDMPNVPQLPPGIRSSELHAGELFGEMSCINFYPRSANVRAKGDCVMLELIRTVLDTVRNRKGKYKEKLDRNYRERSLEQHLNSIPLFKDLLDPEFIDELRRRVELIDFDPGQVIFKQKDEPDAFYLVRRGCVKVTQKQPGGEMVLTYLGQNDSFGEIGLLRNVPRTATCIALDHVELVKISKKNFDFLIRCYDDFKIRMEREADERLAVGRSMAVRPPALPLGEFIDQELMQAQNMLLLDLEKCTRCDECVKACVDSHDDGITRLLREGTRFDKFLLATSCRSCMDPVCMIGCPVGSIRREASFEIIIEDWCIGCEKCAKQCPYGNISMHTFPKSEKEIEKDLDALRKKDPEAAAAASAAISAALASPAGKGLRHHGLAAAVAAAAEIAGAEKDPAMKVAIVKDLAITCDQCSTLQEPSCVYACPHEAALRVNARDFFEIVGKSALQEKTKSVKRD